MHSFKHQLIVALVLTPFALGDDYSCKPFHEIYDDGKNSFDAWLLD